MHRFFPLLIFLLATPLPPALAEDLKAEVRGLVHRLDAAQLADRDAAEAELLRRGPAVLDELPSPNEIASAECAAADGPGAGEAGKDRFRRGRRRLDRHAPRRRDPFVEGARRTATPVGQPTGRLSRKVRPTCARINVSVHLDRTPFWPALDQLLDRAGMTVYPYSDQRAIAVIDAGGRKRTAAGHVCYSGPLRFETTDITARRDLRTPNDGTLTVTIETAWEPRLPIIVLLQRMADIRAVDDRGRALPVADAAAQLEIPGNGRTAAVKIDLPLGLPPRDAGKIASLHGRLTALVPGKIETFRFRKPSAAKNAQQRIAGVVVTLEGTRRQNTDAKNSPRPLAGEGPGVRAESKKWPVARGQGSEIYITG